MSSGGHTVAKSVTSEGTQVNAADQQQQQRKRLSQSQSDGRDSFQAGLFASSPSAPQPLQWSRILITMASMSIAAYFLTSSIMQLTFALFGIGLCGVRFGDDDPNSDVTWLVASCWMSGLLRFLLSLCIGRPAFNRSVWSRPSGHPAFTEQMEALAFLPDVRPRSRDMSVLDRAQLAAGIIHPAFYHRTLLVAWQEGLLTTIWMILHVKRMFTLSSRFPSQSTNEVWIRDRYLDELFASMGSNFTNMPLLTLNVILNERSDETINLLKSAETVNQLVHHTCELMARSAAETFYTEDFGLLGLLGITLLVLPMLSRMLRFFYSR